jgi:hypothetical protein
MIPKDELDIDSSNKISFLNIHQFFLIYLIYFVIGIGRVHVTPWLVGIKT